MSSTAFSSPRRRTPEGTRFIHALNFDGVDKTVRIYDRGVPLFEGRAVMLRRRDGAMLPVGLDVGDTRVAWSTAEIVEVREQGVTVRLTGEADAVSLVTQRAVVVSPEHELTVGTDDVLVTSRVPGTGDELLAIDWM